MNRISPRRDPNYKCYTYSDLPRLTAEYRAEKLAAHGGVQSIFKSMPMRVVVSVASFAWNILKSIPSFVLKVVQILVKCQKVLELIGVVLTAAYFLLRGVCPKIGLMISFTLSIVSFLRSKISFAFSKFGEIFFVLFKLLPLLGELSVFQAIGVKRLALVR